MPPLMHECSADGGGQAMVLEEEEDRSGGGGGPEVETNRTPANRCKAIHAGVRPMARLEHRASVVHARNDLHCRVRCFPSK
jgi:hypothetical protein